MSKEDQIRIKSFLQAQGSNASTKIYISYVPYDISFDDLVAKLSIEFQRNVRLLSWEDDEGDKVTIVVAEDLEEAFSCYKRNKSRSEQLTEENQKPVTLKLYCADVGPLLSNVGVDPLASKFASNQEDSATPEFDYANDSYWNKYDVDGTTTSTSIVSFGGAMPAPRAMTPVFQRNPQVTNYANEEAQLKFQKGTKVIGSGAFGTVYQGLVRDTGDFIAVKEIRFPAEEFGSRRLLEVDKEIDLLRSLDHVHCVRYLGSFREGDCINVVMEYCDGGSLNNMLKMFGALPENVVRNYTRQMLLGMDYLHKRNVVHRDIKSANLLLHEKGKILKLSDFGCSKLFTGMKMSQSGFTNLYGTPVWMAPEVIQQTGAGRASDIWSLGCVTLEMSSGKPPWSEAGQLAIAPMMFHIVGSKGHPEYPENLSLQCTDFLDMCFRLNPKERPMTDDLLDHGFILNAADSRLIGDLPRRSREVNLMSSRNEVEKRVSKMAREIQGEMAVPEVYKIVLLGASGAGKTCVAVQFARSHWVEYYNPRVEEVYRKEVRVDGVVVNLDILDPGPEEEGAHTHKMLEDGDGYILLYDVTSDDSALDIAQAFAHRVLQKNSVYLEGTVPMILVGNKTDEEAARQIPKEQAKQVATQLQMSHFEVTAKDNAQVSELFFAIVRLIRERAMERRSGHAMIPALLNDKGSSGKMKKNRGDGKKCSVM